MNHQRLHLIDQPPTTRQQDALAEIQREHHKSRWHPIQNPQQRSALDTDSILSRSTYAVVVAESVPLWRRLWRWLMRSIW